MLEWGESTGSGALIVCKEGFHVESGTFVDNATLGEENDIVNQIPNEEGRFVQGDDDATCEGVIRGVSFEEFHYVEGSFGVEAFNGVFAEKLFEKETVCEGRGS